MNLEKITPEELVDGFMVPAHLTDEQRRTANLQLANVRQKRMAERSQQEKLYGQLLQLKIQMEDYIRQDTYDPKKSFSHFLNSYIELLQKKKNEVASELAIHKTKLSQLLSGHREPSEEIFIRLELHSNRFIPAHHWFRLSVKKQEHALMTNSSLRNRERAHVKAGIELAL
ncbi:hypothetical protein [Telluribacter humicola]|uniref:hypothetical protein n=1 Tax=Telluribacter humicola TaxID=1720261 RepID=UPI001A978ACE|nr:hypothetical protein [Telluribacter humicola]